MFTLRQVTTDVHADRSVCRSTNDSVHRLTARHCDRGDGHPSGVYHGAHRRVRIWTSIHPVIRRDHDPHRQFHEKKATPSHEVPLLVLLLPHRHHGPVPRSHISHDSCQRVLHLQWNRILWWLILFLRFIQFYGNKQECLDGFKKSLLT